MDEDHSDDSAIWPSYVDFLATFSFVLFIFIGSLMVLMYGQLGERAFKRKTAAYVSELQGAGIDASVEGFKIKFDLSKKVQFDQNDPTHPYLKPSHIEYLHTVALKLPEGIAVAGANCKLVVLGKADSAPFKGDPFGNWNLSATRALLVLKYLYNCPNCNFDKDLREKLVLLGEGDVEANPIRRADDRSVDLVIDCEKAR